MQVNQIRQKFIEFFKSKGHEVVKSSSLIPHDDPSLLFTNAGMNQFKNTFLGLERRAYTRAVSAQKCVRAGGKHNDLENVGYTARHHTFFEMLGNFSFGDYFKRDAIVFAWEFLTAPQWLNLPADKLYVTVYHSDAEAYAIWQQEIGLAPERIICIGDKGDGSSDNFWQMGDSGPCGPCTEIFYDHGPQVWGGLPGSAEEDGDRYIEIWNNVFMQYNRDEAGVLHKLPQPSVDTGMGIERLAAVLQQVHSNYEIDLFVAILNAAAVITQTADLHNPSLKVLADHIRAVAFLIADGVLPANEGRGYVLRRIMRRAIRHGYKLNCREPFFYRLVASLVAQMGDAYPELILNQETIERVIQQEEERFFQTIEFGMDLLQHELQPGIKVLSGAIAFKLYDTYGFPLDLTQDVCRELNIQVDELSFASHMEHQKAMAKAAGKFKMVTNLEYDGGITPFTGYTEISEDTTIVALYVNNRPVDFIAAGDSAVIVLERTPFYAESGGQVGDSGTIVVNGGASSLFKVEDTQKIRPQVHGHRGKLLNGKLKVGDSVVATVDLHQRLATARNHSATHLLHQALHEVVGAHALQKGSLVNAKVTRFDFAHDKALSVEQIKTIEGIVNRVIRHNYPVLTQEMTYDAAIKAGALALFGEKYDSKVRAVQMGNFSTELCGGTHVTYTGEIGLFIIRSEGGIANGIRRIEALSGEAAVEYLQQNLAILTQIRDQVKAPNNLGISSKISALFDENKSCNKEIKIAQSKLVALQAKQLLDQATMLQNGAQLLVLRLDNTSSKALVELNLQLKEHLSSGIVVLGAVNDNLVNLVVGVTKDLTAHYKAGEIINKLAAVVGGRGGGRPDFAQAGGNDPTQLESALQLAQTMFTN
jgi:alanyl-tRNA synthetase